MTFPGAIWRPGPVSKVNGGTNPVNGVVLHSMVGYEGGAMAELDNPLRRASWHFSVLQDGRVLQHYSERAQTWHAGSIYNNYTVGIEHEGGFDPEDEALTPAQLLSSVALVRWLSTTFNFPMTRHAGMWEHNEVSVAPTSCPSHRIPWQFYTEDEMTLAQMKELKDYFDMKLLQMIGWINSQKFTKQP